MAAVTLDVAGLARLDQVLLGLLPADALPGADGDDLLDEEGTPVGRREAGGVIGLRAPRWPRPQESYGDSAVVVAVAEQLPAGLLPPGARLLLPAAGVRSDNARYQQWTAAWRASASEVVEIPITPGEAASRAAEIAALYSSGELLQIPTTAQPANGGKTVFLTGFSGSGKSTIARSLVEVLAERRAVTLLDGDVVRTHLSRGLGFSREDRDINIRRIGWVAAEVTKHGGVAVCAPIAPYDETRRWVRELVEAAGGPGAFVLVWISTPIEECERRDVKGLYAKARAGEITGFTGIDDPYEEPLDAELVIDTTTVSVAEAVAAILARLAK
ncbi:MAG TPA: adenylyl-sulfate kinase [Mycobacteriales bacterium]|nr:adenylyl-sulfate kinase [Mycobacteriales bacterium]HWC34605.1 adenylyl-sulfate kinase [Mycobacteriales bacterium]